MANLAWSFPVFYCCAIKGRTSLNQHDILNILFVGKYTDECDSKCIAPSIGSGYISGKRPLSKELISTLCRTEYGELENRFRKIALQDYESSAENLRLFLIEIKPLGEVERKRLLDIAQTGEPFRFLVETFLSAIKSPAGIKATLNSRQQQYLQAGAFEQLKNDDVHTNNEQGHENDKRTDPLQENISNGNGREHKSYDSFSMRSMITEHFEGLYSEFELRQRRLLLPDDLEFVTHYADAFTEEGVPPAGARKPVIFLRKELLSQFVEELSRFTQGYLVEALGRLEQLSHTIPRITTLRGCESILILTDISPENNINDIQKLHGAIKNAAQRNLRLYYGIRVTARLNSTIFFRMIYADIPLPHRPQRLSSPSKMPVYARRKS